MSNLPDEDEPVLCLECGKVYIDPADDVCAKCYHLVWSLNGKAYSDQLNEEQQGRRRRAKSLSDTLSNRSNIIPVNIPIVRVHGITQGIEPTYSTTYVRTVRYGDQQAKS